MGTLIQDAAEVATCATAIDAAIVAKGGTLVGGGKLRNAAAGIAAIPTVDYPTEWTHDYTEVTIDLSDATGDFAYLLTVPWRINVLDATAGIVVAFGDGATQSLTTAGDQDIYHTYAEPGVYTMRITSATAGLTWEFQYKGIVYFANVVYQYQGVPWARRIRGIGIGTNCRLGANSMNTPLQYCGPCWLCINPANSTTGNPNTYSNNGWAGNAIITYFSGWPSGITNLVYTAVTPTRDAKKNAAGAWDILPANCTTLANSSFQNNTAFTSVVLPTALTTIPYGLFYGCSKMTSVTIPQAVTSIVNNVFHDCYILPKVEIPSGVTSINGHYLFDQCYSLREVILRPTTPPTLSSISNMFDSAGEAFGSTGVVTVRVPASAQAAYEADTNWAAVFALTNVTEATWDDSASE